MPKEVIRDIAPTGTSEKFDDLAVEITWGRDTGHVQIATVNYGRDQYTEERGWFRDVNRDEINRVIRILRKARDQAFGPDE